MAMSGAVLGQAAWDAVKAQTGATYSPTEEAAALAIWTAIATEIVNHITTNATVNVTVANVSLVTPGVGVSGPGTGTGVIS